MKKKTSKTFSESKFWSKLNRTARRIGMKVVYPAVLLFYLFKSKDVPLKAKSFISGALVYFIVPLDGLPDFLPFLGYTDDLSLLAATLSHLVQYISPEIKAQTRKKVSEWFKSFVEINKMEEKYKRLES